MIDWIAISLGITKDTVVTGLITVAIAIPTIGVAIWAVCRNSKPTLTAPESGIRVDATVLAEKYAEEARKRGALEAENANLRTALAGRDEQAEKAVAAAIADLQEDSRTAADPAPFDKALAELAEGRPDAAENLFAEILDRRKAEGQAALKEAAEAARHIGAIAFFHDTQKALAAYVEATELDPDDAEAWNQLGHLQHRLGNLAAAETAYQTVLRLGNNMEDQALLAVAYGNLGIVFQTRGDLDDAEEMYRKSLAIEKALGRKEGMASEYGNLGNVFQTRGDLDDAEEMYRKALALNEALGSKEGMASDYGNLGVVYQTRGDIAGACEAWAKSRDLFTVIGAAHMVEQVSGWMKDAGCES